MIKGINVEITLRDNDTGSYLEIPVLPAVLQYRDGNKKVTTVNIINLGDVDIPKGVALDSIGWPSQFPARYDPAYCKTSQLLEPLQYRNRFSSWKDAGTSLQLICPAAGINKTMYIASFTWDYGRGFEGDIYYQINFKELKTLRPKQLTPSGTVPPKNKKQPSERPAAPQKPKPESYTVQSGDTLTLIAKKLSISDWHNDLYEPNRGVIGPNPNAIQPGQVLAV